jgi:hypothetical protein
LSPTVTVSPASAALPDAGEAAWPGTFAAADVGPTTPTGSRLVAATLVPGPFSTVAPGADVLAARPCDAAVLVAVPLVVPLVVLAADPATAVDPAPLTVAAARASSPVAVATFVASVVCVADGPAPEVSPVPGPVGVVADVVDSAGARSLLASAAVSDVWCAARAFSLSAPALSWVRRGPASDRSRASRRLRSNARASGADPSVRVPPRRPPTPVLASAVPVEGGSICAIIAILLTSAR